MPLYEFRCDFCHETFERRCTLVARGNTYYCPECSAPMLRVIPLPHLHGSENMPNG